MENGGIPCENEFVRKLIMELIMEAWNGSSNYALRDVVVRLLKIGTMLLMISEERSVRDFYLSVVKQETEWKYFEDKGVIARSYACGNILPFRRTANGIHI